MVNQIAKAADIKIDKAGSLFPAGQETGTAMQSSAKRQNLKAGAESAMLPREDNSTPDVSVFINGQEKSLANQEKKKDITPEDAEKMSEALNEFMDKLKCDIQFKYNDKLEFMTIKMINKKTKEVIKEFPPEEILKTMEKTQEWIGIFLDKNA